MTSKKEIEANLKQEITNLAKEISRLTVAWKKEPSSKVRNDIFINIQHNQGEINNFREELSTIISGSKSPSGIDDLHSDQDDEEENTWRNSP